MSVKTGDMAIVISSTCGNEGIIVEVGLFLGKVPFYKGTDRFQVKSLGRKIVDNFGLEVRHLSAIQLKPVSGLSEDESTDTSNDLDMSVKAVA